MLDTPPHVLVTNYAMLEHLLLLPKNAALFEESEVKFIVLDEIHSYSGAQATEVALLLRKLQSRYCKGQGHLHRDQRQPFAERGKREADQEVRRRLVRCRI